MIKAYSKGSIYRTSVFREKKPLFTYLGWIDSLQSILNSECGKFGKLVKRDMQHLLLWDTKKLLTD